MDNKEILESQREESAQVASEGAIVEQAGDLIDGAARALCKYVNIVAGQQVLALPDNEIRRMLIQLLLVYTERKKDES